MSAEDRRIGGLLLLSGVLAFGEQMNVCHNRMMELVVHFLDSLVPSSPQIL